jgi:glucan endo-1,3-alpha-glucosidase
MDCFAATKRLPESTAFKLFFSFDMTYASPFSAFRHLFTPFSSSVSGNSAGDVQLFRNYLSELYQSPRMFRHPTTGGLVISTFCGENSTFGQGSIEDGWAYLKNELNKITPVRLPCSLLSFQIRLTLSRSTSFHHSSSTQRVIPVFQL